ncbi:MAG: DinB family protein [Acidobacteriia bacterium]|nr:DinB family protein [Terriglobia bacterium]
MVPLATIRELFAYNYWARDRQLEACAKLSQEQFLRPLGNSFPSLRDTLAHLVTAEWIWHEWLRRGSAEKRPAPEDFPDLQSIHEGWRPIEQGLRDYLANATDETLAGRLSFSSRVMGKTMNYPVWRALLHLANHQSYHRGQVTMCLRLLGVQPQMTDIVVADREGALDEIGGQKYLQQSA